jgi:septal ring factor EnvC (AmiA/AmiB activator)
MMKKHSVEIAVPALKTLTLAAGVCVSLAGCQTTGDPSQGGLFGWSEAKAIERQNLLRDQLAASSNAERDQRERQESLQSNRSQLQRDVAARNRQLQSLQSEITALRNALASGNLPADAAAQRADALRAPVEASTGPGSDQLRSDFAEIDQQINLLTQ